MERMRKTDPPCKNCTDREAGCHAVCSRYKGWKQDTSEKFDEFVKATSKDVLADRHKKQTISRLKWGR